MQILTYISVFYAYLVNDRLSMASKTGIVGITPLFFSTTLLHPELTQHNLERGVGLGFREM
jgi:hypothetical protein